MAAEAAERAEIARGRAAVGMLNSDAGALREAGTPSPAFRLGAALAAWTNAADQVAFNITNPEAVGPAHAHLDGPDDFFGDDCRAETAAFEHLVAAALELSLSPDDAVAAADLPKDAAVRWSARAQGPVAACR